MPDLRCILAIRINVSVILSDFYALASLFLIFNSQLTEALQLRKVDRHNTVGCLQHSPITVLKLVWKCILYLSYSTLNPFQSWPKMLTGNLWFPKDICPEWSWCGCFWNLNVWSYPSLSLVLHGQVADSKTV